MPLITSAPGTIIGKIGMGYYDRAANDGRGAYVSNYGVTKHQPLTPGIHIEVLGIRSSKYVRVVHSLSGKILRSFNEAALKGSLRDFNTRLDRHLSGVDWSRTEDVIVADPKAKDKVMNIYSVFEPLAVRCTDVRNSNNA